MSVAQRIGLRRIQAEKSSSAHDLQQFFAAVHGIVDNQFWDTARRERFDYSNDASWIEAEPLWAPAFW